MLFGTFFNRCVSRLFLAVQTLGHSSGYDGRMPKTGGVHASRGHAGLGIPTRGFGQTFVERERYRFRRGRGPHATRNRVRLGNVSAESSGQIFHRVFTTVFLVRLGERHYLYQVFFFFPFVFFPHTRSDTIDRRERIFAGPPLPRIARTLKTFRSRYLLLTIVLLREYRGIAADTITFIVAVVIAIVVVVFFCFSPTESLSGTRGSDTHNKPAVYSQRGNGVVQTAPQVEDPKESK